MVGPPVQASLKPKEEPLAWEAKIVEPPPPVKPVKKNITGYNFKVSKGKMIDINIMANFGEHFLDVLKKLEPNWF